MLIIIEGPDGAGKSTLAGRLLVELALRLEQNDDVTECVRVVHRGPPIAHPLTEYEGPMLRYRPLTGHDVVADRWHLGELVYPDLVGRDTRYDPAVHRHIDMFLQSRGALLVGMHPPEDELVRRLEAREPRSTFDQITIDNAGRVLDRYQLSYDLSGVEVLQVHDEPQVNTIIAAAERLAHGARRLVPFTTYVGPPTPDVLLFGETRGVDGRHAHGSTPAFMSYPGTSGHYLLSLLDPNGAWRLGLANACDVDDPLALWKTLGEPRVVALGRKASVKLAWAGVPCGTVPHPQFVRRFHHDAGHLYAVLIRDVAREGEDAESWRP
jgi:hypothetical protein